MGKDREWVRAVAIDHAQVVLPEEERRMLAFAVELTRNPGATSQSGVEALRQVGMGDRALFDLCHVVSYYNYVNRLADGLAVELEPNWGEEDLTLNRAEFEQWRGRMQRSGESV